jgi:uncharacterized protein
MTTELWINLPVKDPVRSQAFFAALGFIAEPQHPGTDGAGVLVGDDGVRVMLFPEDTFREFTRHGLPDTGRSTQVLFSFSAGSRDEVDTLARRVEAAGGTLFAEPEEIQGWMYGCAFIDLDGHRWNVLHMPVSQEEGATSGEP